VAARVARSLGDESLLAEAEVWRGCALNQLGRVDEGRRVQEEAVALAEATGDVISLSHALNDIAFLSEIGGELAQSRRWKLRALALAERTGDPAAIANMAFRCGQNAFLSGDWRRARAYFERALDTARGSDAASVLPYPLFGLALLARARENWEEVETYCELSLSAALECDDKQAIRAAHSLLAEREIARGDPSSAADRLRRFADSEDGLELRSSLPVLAEAALLTGDIATARQCVERAAHAAEARGNRMAQLDTLRVAALLAVEEGRAADAQGAVDEALRLARAMPHPWAEARLLLASARVAELRGDSPAQDREAAQDILDRLSANGERPEIANDTPQYVRAPLGARGAGGAD